LAKCIKEAVANLVKYFATGKGEQFYWLAIENTFQVVLVI
jgi:hypothetical protein